MRKPEKAVLSYLAIQKNLFSVLKLYGVDIQQEAKSINGPRVR